MAVLLTVGIMPMDWTVTKAAASTVHSFDATAQASVGDDKAVIAEGTTFNDGYFKIVGKVTQRTNSDGSIKAYELASKATGAVQFTTESASSVVVGLSSTGGSNESAVALINTADNSVVAEDAGTAVVAGTKKTELKYTALPAGTYQVVSPEDADRNRACRFFDITVEEEEAAAVTTTYAFAVADLSPAAYSVTADKTAIAEGTFFASDYVKTVGTATFRTKSSSDFSALKAIELGSKASGALQFTVTGTASVSFEASSTGGSNESAIALVNTADNSTVAEDAGTTIVKGTNATKLTYSSLPAGTYQIVSPEDADRNRGVRVLSFTAEQTASGERPARKAWEDVAAPAIGEITAADGKITVPFTMVIGYDGADKRIDEIALVIKHEGTIYDLMKVEQAYAPPFSSAKDPVAVAGYVAENIITGKVQPVYWRQLRDIEMENNFLLDVRTPDEFSLNTLPGAVNIPLDELRDRLDELPKDKMIYTFCAVGLRGYLAYRILVQHGFEKVRNLSGGLKTYHAAAAPIILREESENEVPAQPNANIQQPADAQPQKTVSPVEAVKTIRVDACGLQCPGPILKMKKTMDSLVSGDRVEITSTDPGFPRDAAAWCNSTGNQLISKETAGGKSVVVIEKGEPKSCNIVTSCEGKGKTFIMFSDDLDKALATFVLANGAAATGQKVTIFFTFWGLNVIKKLHKPNVEKDIFGKMFGMMLPSSSRKLKLSKMSMGGIGGKMMRYIMNRKGIDSLESLRQQALENGVEFIACQMSMDVMGVKQEELLDEVTIGGVATYMERADNANINLFI